MSGSRPASLAPAKICRAFEARGRDDVKDDCSANPRWRLHRLHDVVDDGRCRTSAAVVAGPRRDVTARVSGFRAVCRLRRAPADSRDRNLGLGALTPAAHYSRNRKSEVLKSPGNAGVGILDGFVISRHPFATQVTV